MSKNKQTISPGDANTLAVLHLGGDRWYTLIARTDGGRPSIIATRSFATSEASSIDQWFDEYQVGQVLAVLPASMVVCRTCVLPNANEQQLEMALSLQTEAQVSTLAPPHRLGAAVLHASDEETTRSGLMVAWPESAAFEIPAFTRPVNMTPDIAALASLLNGSRPVDPLLWLDRKSGALALSLCHSNGAVFRCTQEDARDPESWQTNISRAITETGLNVGHSDQFLKSIVQETRQRIASLNGTPSALFLPGEIIHNATARLEGAGDDPSWWTEYGIAAGALLARCDHLQSLTRMEVIAPIQKPSPFRAAFDWMSIPKSAVMCTIACVLMLILGPMVFHGLRLLIMNMRFDDIQSQLTEVESLQHKLDMYNELSDHAWSMTKLLSDFVSSTPEGIELNYIRINHNDGLITVSGLAQPYEGAAATVLIAKMQEDLEKTKIFTDTSYSWGDPNNFGQYEFTLSTRTVKPNRRVNYSEEADFAVRTMQMRIDKVSPEKMQANASENSGISSLVSDETPRVGNQAISGSTAVVESIIEEEVIPAARSERNGSRRPSSPDRGGTALNRSEVRGGGNTLPPSENIPEPLTEGQIQAMSIDQAYSALKKNADARKLPRLDDETKARLKTEFGLLMKALREKKKQP